MGILAHVSSMAKRARADSDGEGDDSADEGTAEEGDDDSDDESDDSDYYSDPDMVTAYTVLPGMPNPSGDSDEDMGSVLSATTLDIRDLQLREEPEEEQQQTEEEEEEEEEVTEEWRQQVSFIPGDICALIVELCVMSLLLRLALQIAEADDIKNRNKEL